MNISTSKHIYVKRDMIKEKRNTSQTGRISMSTATVASGSIPHTETDTVS